MNLEVKKMKSLKELREEREKQKQQVAEQQIAQQLIQPTQTLQNPVSESINAPISVVVQKCNHIASTLYYLQFGREICGDCGTAYVINGQWKEGDDSLLKEMQKELDSVQK